MKSIDKRKMKNRDGKTHTSLKPSKSSEYTTVAYERLQSSCIPFLALTGATTSSKKHWDTQRYTDALNRAVGPPASSKGIYKCQHRVVGHSLTSFRGVTSSSLRDNEPIASSHSQLRAAARCQHPFGTHRPNHLSSILFCISAATTIVVLEGVPTNTLPVRAPSAR